ncbi:MAG: PKD domain-containing protein, partial [Bacteroidota bacterium]
MKIKPTIFFFIAFLLSARISYAQVVANFSSAPPSGCAPLTIAFSDLSTGTPTSWSWNLGNGNSSTLQNPSAVYSTPGTYTVTLVASKSGSSSTKTATITIFGKPTANFTTSAMPSCVGQTITFTDGSTGGGTLTSWAWDFGDGNILTTSTGVVTHSYSSGGTFPVSLIVTDNNGCSSSIIKSVIVLASPVAAFTGTPLSSCSAPLTVNFTNSSVTFGTVSYLWKFGDGTSNSTAVNPSHTYTASGSYKVTLIVTQGACIDSVVKNNYVVIQNITADFSANATSGCVGSAITFTDMSLPLSTSRTWGFGDGSPTSTLANPTHTYTAPGTYTVSLLNSSANGCSDSEIKTAYITIHPSPVANFTADNTQSCNVPFTVNFTDNSSGATSWLWNFGDGSPTSTSQNPSHNFTSEGVYTVNLIVTSINGCKDTIVKSNYIIVSRPVASFTATPRQGCVPLLVNFTSTSTSLLDPIINYSWNFGNGTASTASPSITNTYTLPGAYTVRLI